MKRRREDQRRKIEQDWKGKETCFWKLRHDMKKRGERWRKKGKKVEDRQRLEREGDEMVEAIRRHE